jgi:hypothetical protein
VKVNGNTISVQGTLPPSFQEGRTVNVTAAVAGPGDGAVEQPAPHAVKLVGIRSPELDLSQAKRQDGPYPLAYEAFHYLSLPNSRDLACTVIQALGDKFDLLAYYSDFPRG